MVREDHCFLRFPSLISGCWPLLAPRNSSGSIKTQFGSRCTLALARGRGGGFPPRPPAGSGACALQQGPVPPPAPYNWEGLGSLGRWAGRHPTRGGVSGAEPERLSRPPHPGRAQIPAARTMAAAALRQVGSRPGGRPCGEAHFRVDPSPVASPAWHPLLPHSGSAAGRRGGGGPGESSTRPSRRGGGERSTLGRGPRWEPHGGERGGGAYKERAVGLGWRDGLGGNRQPVGEPG